MVVLLPQLAHVENNRHDLQCLLTTDFALFPNNTALCLICQKYAHINLCEHTNITLCLLKYGKVQSKNKLHEILDNWIVATIN